MPTSAWSQTAAGNGATLGIDIAENCDAANINNALREIMAQLKVKLDAIDAAAVTIDATLVALGNLTTAANQMIYSTGVDTFAMTTLSTFMRTVLDDGDAATARATLGISELSVVSNGNGKSISLPISGTTYRLQFGTVSVAGETSASITFPEAFSGTPVCVCSGGSTNTGADANHRITAVTSSGATITSSATGTNTSQWIAVGA